VAEEEDEEEEEIKACIKSIYRPITRLRRKRLQIYI